MENDRDKSMSSTRTSAMNIDYDFPTNFFVVSKLFCIFADWKCVSKYYDYDKTYNETIPDAADNAAVTSAVTCDNFMYDR